LVRIIDADATTLGRSEEGVRGFEAKTKEICTDCVDEIVSVIAKRGFLVG
jgi:hypothetical protein